MRHPVPTGSSRRRPLSGGADVSGATVALSSDVLVRQWVDAFNARDFEGMLARIDSEVRLHPLRLRGLDCSYDGYDGVQRWFARPTQLRHEHVVVLSDVHGSRDDQVLAVGSLSWRGMSRLRLSARCIGSLAA
jgi:SnoaL-like domain